MTAETKEDDDGGGLMVARLPDEWVDHSRIENMEMNQRRFVVPWAMIIDEDQRCFLESDAQTSRTMGGTVCLPIERRADGYHVWLTRGVELFFRWSPSRIGSGFVPVVAIHTSE